MNYENTKTLLKAGQQLFINSFKIFLLNLLIKILNIPQILFGVGLVVVVQDSAQIFYVQPTHPKLLYSTKLILKPEQKLSRDLMKDWYLRDCDTSAAIKLYSFKQDINNQALITKHCFFGYYIRIFIFANNIAKPQIYFCQMSSFLLNDQFIYYFYHYQLFLQTVRMIYRRYIDIIQIMPQFLLLLFFISLALSFQTTKIDKRITLPSHQYRVDLYQYFNYSINLSWNDGSDLGAEVYEPGFQNYKQVYETRSGFTYSCPKTAQYTFKIKPLMIKQKIACYYLSIKGQNITDSSFENCFLEGYFSYSAIAIPVQSYPTTIKYDTSEPVIPEYYCFNNIGPFFSKMNEIYSFGPQCSKQIIILLRENQRTNLTSFTIYLQVGNHCQDGDCLVVGAKDSMGTTFVIIIAILSIPFAVLIIFLAYKIRICIKRRNEQAASDIQVLPESSRNRNRVHPHLDRKLKPLSSTIDNSLQQINKEEQKQSLTCAICLDNCCNVKLICNHQFHRDCIGNWVKENKSCPVCRQILN